MPSRCRSLTRRSASCCSKGVILRLVVAMMHPESIAAAVSRLMRGMARIGAPIEWVLSATTDLILHLFRLHAEPVPVTDEEIGFMLREGAARGHIPQAATAIVEKALRLGGRP